MAEANRQMITQKGVAIWLDADVDVLWERVRHKDTRPLLRTDNPKQTLTDLYKKRVPIYRLADMSVTSASGISLEEMGRRVQAALADQRPDVLETVA
jgi:shikimate kinase